MLIASDAPWLRGELRAAIEGMGYDVTEVADGPAAVRSILAGPPELALLDSQMGNMGGMATCLELHLEESAGRMPHVPVILVLDRRADVFLARRSNAEGFLIKPLSPIRTRRAVREVLAGGSYADPSQAPAKAAAVR